MYFCFWCLGGCSCGLPLLPDFELKPEELRITACGLSGYSDLCLDASFGQCTSPEDAVWLGHGRRNRINQVPHASRLEAVHPGCYVQFWIRIDDLGSSQSAGPPHRSLKAHNRRGRSCNPLQILKHSQKSVSVCFSKRVARPLLAIFADQDSAERTRSGIESSPDHIDHIWEYTSSSVAVSWSHAYSIGSIRCGIPGELCIRCHRIIAKFYQELLLVNGCLNESVR